MSIINRKITSYAASITEGASPVIDLTNEKFLGFQNAADGTTTVTFYGSSDGVTFGALYIDGSALTATTPPVNTTWIYSSKSFEGLRYLKLVVATTARTLKIITEVL
jgi:hypothetical protein